ncbi:phage polarity suppression protein, partial [Escherichia coli]
LPSETMIWQPEFTDKTLSRKPGAVHSYACKGHFRKSGSMTSKRY